MGALVGKSLLQFSTGTPAEVGTLDSWVDAQGARYLDGVIMMYPADIGEESV